MASITSAGIGSGLEVTSLVSQLVAAERAPAQSRLTTAKQGVQLQISSLGAYRSVMDALKTAVDALKGGASVNKLLATSGDDKVFTATAATGAVAGSYEIEVVELAKAHKLVSGPYAGSGASVGTDPVVITVGGSTFQVQLSAGSESLADLRNAINNAADNAGVTATIVNEVVNGVTSSRLLLTSKDVGSAHAISVTGLALTERQAATDAHLVVEGYDHYSSSNSVSGAIDGITLDLKSAAPGDSVTLTVALDANAGKAALGNFVSAYNRAVQTIAQLTRFDPTTKTGGPLMGDASVRSMTRQIREVVGGLIQGGGSFSMLAELGISTATDGTLSIDSTKLAAAIATDQAGVQNLFSGSGGVATRLSAMLAGFLGDDGQLEAETDGLQARLTDIGKQQSALDRRMTALESRYKAQFTALDSLIGQLRTTSEFLTRQLATLSTT